MSKVRVYKYYSYNSNNFRKLVECSEFNCYVEECTSTSCAYSDDNVIVTLEYEIFKRDKSLDVFDNIDEEDLVNSRVNEILNNYEFVNELLENIRSYARDVLEEFDDYIDEYYREIEENDVDIDELRKIFERLANVNNIDDAIYYASIIIEHVDDYNLEELFVINVDNIVVSDNREEIYYKVINYDCSKCLYEIHEKHKYYYNCYAQYDLIDNQVVEESFECDDYEDEYEYVVYRLKCNFDTSDELSLNKQEYEFIRKRLKSDFNIKNFDNIHVVFSYAEDIVVDVNYSDVYNAYYTKRYRYCDLSCCHEYHKTNEYYDISRCEIDKELLEIVKNIAKRYRNIYENEYYNVIYVKHNMYAIVRVLHRLFDDIYTYDRNKTNEIYVKLFVVE